MVLTLLPAQAAYAEETDTAVVETVEAEQTAQDTTDTAPAADASQDNSSGKVMAFSASAQTQVEDDYPAIVLFPEEEYDLTAGYSVADADYTRSADDAIYSWSAGSTPGVIKAWSAKNTQTVTIKGGTPGITTIGVVYTCDGVKWTEYYDVNVIGLTNIAGDLVDESSFDSYNGNAEYTGVLDIVYDGTNAQTKADNYFEKDTITILGAQAGATISVSTPPDVDNEAVGAAKAGSDEAAGKTNDVMPNAAVSGTTASTEIQAKALTTSSTGAKAASNVTVTYKYKNSDLRTMVLTETVYNHYLEFVAVDKNGYALGSAAPIISTPRNTAASFQIAADGIQMDSPTKKYLDATDVTLAYEVDVNNRSRLSVTPSGDTLAANTYSVSSSQYTLNPTTGTIAGNAEITFTASKEVDGNVVKIGTYSMTVKVTDTAVALDPSGVESALKLNYFPSGTNSITVKYTKTGNGVLTWKSSDETVAKVVRDQGSGAGINVYYYKSGQATISCYSSESDSEAVASFLVRVDELYADGQTLTGTTDPMGAIVNVKPVYKAQTFEINKAGITTERFIKDGVYTDSSDTELWIRKDVFEGLVNNFNANGDQLTNWSPSWQNKSYGPDMESAQWANLAAELNDNNGTYRFTNFGSYFAGEGVSEATSNIDYQAAESLYIRPVTGTGITNWTVTWGLEAGIPSAVLANYSTKTVHETKSTDCIELEKVDGDQNQVLITGLQPGRQNVTATYSYNYTVDGKTKTVSGSRSVTITVQTSSLNAGFKLSETESAASASTKATIGSTITLLPYAQFNGKVVTSGLTYSWADRTVEKYVDSDWEAYEGTAVTVPATSSDNSASVVINNTASGGERYKISVQVWYQKGDIFEEDEATFEIVVNADYTALYKEVSGTGKADVDETKIHNVFFTADGKSSIGSTNVIAVGINDGTLVDDYTVAGLVTARSTNASIATAQIVANETSSTNLTITPHAVGHTTIQLYLKGGNTPIENSQIDVYVLGVSRDGDALTALTSGKYETALGLVGTNADSMVLSINTPADLDAVSQTVTWSKQTADKVEITQATDNTYATIKPAADAENNTTATLTAAIAIKKTVDGKVETYNITSDSDFVTVKLSKTAVSINSVTFTNQTTEDGIRFAALDAGVDMYATDNAYLTAKITDSANKVASLVFKAYTDDTYKTEKSTMTLTTSSSPVNKRTLYYGSIDVSQLGNYYIKVTALDENGRELASFTNITDVTGGNRIVVGKPVAIGSTETEVEDVYALTNFAPVYTRTYKADGTLVSEKLTGAVSNPTVGDVVTSLEKNTGYYVFNEGWGFQDDSQNISYYASRSDGKVTLTAVYKNANGELVTNEDGTAATKDIAVYVGSLGKIKLVSEAGKDKNFEAAEALADYNWQNSDGARTVYVLRDLQTNATAKLGDFQTAYAEWLNDAITDRSGLAGVSSDKTSVAKGAYGNAYNKVVITPSRAREGSAVITVREFGNSATVTVNVAGTVYNFDSVVMDTASYKGSAAITNLVGGTSDYKADYYTDIENESLVEKEGKVKITATVDVGSNSTNPSVTIVSSNTKVATVTSMTLDGAVSAAHKATFVGEVTVNGTGDTVFTLTGNDKLATKQTLGFHVIKNAPVITDPILDYNTTTKAATVGISWNKISEIKGYKVDTGSAATLEGDTEGNFATSFVDGNIVISVATGKTPVVGDYNLTLNAKATKADLISNTTALSPTLDIKQEITLTVISRNITGNDYAAKQLDTYNIFYKTDDAFIRLENNNAAIGSVALKDAAASMYEIVSTDLDDATVTVRLKANVTDLKSAAKTNNRKLTFLVTPAGYTAAQEVPLTLTVVNKAPVYKLAAKSATLYNIADGGFNNFVETTISTTADTAHEDITQVDVSYTDSGYEIGGSGGIAADGALVVAAKSTTPAAAKSGKVVLTNGVNWQVASYAISLPFKIAVQTKNPKLQLSQKTITLNKAIASLEGGEKYEASYTIATMAGGTEIPSGFTATIVSASKKVSIAENADGTFSGSGLNFDVNGDNVVSVGYDGAAKGSYKVNVVYTNGTITMSTPLTVKVVDTKIDKAITFKTSGKLDLITCAPIEVIPSVKAVTGTISDAFLNSEDYTATEKDPFIVNYNNNNGKITIEKNWDYVLAGGTYATNKSYDVNIALKFENDQSATQFTATGMKTIKFKPTQAKLKGAGVPKVNTVDVGSAGYATLVLYAGNTEGQIATDEDGDPVVSLVKPVPGLTILGGEITNNGAGYTFRYKVDSTVKPGKTLTAKFYVTSAYKASNAKPITVTVKIKTNKN